MTVAQPRSLVWLSADGDVIPFDGTTGVEAVGEWIGIGVAPPELTSEPIRAGGRRLVRKRSQAHRVAGGLFVEATMVDRLVDELAEALAAGGELRHDGPAGPRALIDVEYEGGLEGSTRQIGGRIGRGQREWRRFPLSLVAMTPWWHGDARSFPVALDQIAPVPFSDPTVPFSDPTMPFSGGEAFDLQIVGTPNTPLTVEITGPVPARGVTVTIRERTVRTMVELLAGDVLVVDKAGPRLNGGLIDWRLLTENSRPLVASRGDSMIVGADAVATGSVDVQWRDRWRSP